MILNRNFYNKMPAWKSWWFKRQLLKLTGDKIFKSFKLHKTEWPQKIYFYSPRLRRKPVFIGNAEKLSLWKESKICENICPTQAIKVEAEAIIIDDRGCIGCGLCVEFAPAGLLEMLREVTPEHRS